MNNPRWVVIFAVLLIGGVCFIASACNVDAANVNLSVTNSDIVLELTVPSSVILNLVPTEEVSFGTADLSIGVGTNNRTGYTLSMMAASDTLTRTGSITDGAGITSTPTILPMLTTASASGYTAEQFASSSTNNYTLNRWGYKLSSSNNYMPMTTESVELASTDSAGNANTTTLNFAAKVDMTKPAGTYATTFNFVAVGNALPVYLYDAVASLAKSGDDSAIDFSVVPTAASSGVYKYSGYQYSQNSLSALHPQNVSDWDYDVYYYRGILSEDSAATNYAPNYVKLDNGTCWIILRTTKTGGVKMLYNGKYGETAAGSCTNSGSVVGTGIVYSDSPIALGYGYANWDNSHYGVVNSWYSNSTKGNMTGYTNMLEGDAGYCNDYATDGGDLNTGWGGDNKYMNIAYRKTAPYLECTKDEDLNTVASASAGNKKLIYPVAIATADELILAGAIFSYNNDISNLYIYPGLDTVSLTAEMTCFTYNCPGNDSSYRVYTLSSKGVGSKDCYASRDVTARPVISLVHTASIASGAGTATDPWVISAP